MLSFHDRYLHSDPPQYVDPSSEHRLARVKELPRPNDTVDLLTILGDTHDPQYPIYRNGAPPDTAATIATGTVPVIYSSSIVGSQQFVHLVDKLKSTHE